MSEQTTNPRQNVTFASNGQQAHGYLAVPSSGSGPGVVVIQEWWGLTDHISGVCDRLAAEGFVALAPDLFGGATTHDAEEAGRLMGELPVDRAARDLSGAVDYLLGHDAVTGGQVGVVGFCMGGGFVLHLAALAGDKVGAAVDFYNVFKSEPDLSGIRAAVQGHFGEQDAFYPVEQARALEVQLREKTGAAEVEFFYYPAGHAFHNDENLIGTHDADHAATAWSRTVDFLGRHLKRS
ncbi:MAG: dienelactone hydrolase family protein [Actinomycetes bacterium]